MSAVPEKASSASASPSEIRSHVLVIGGGPGGCWDALKAAPAWCWFYKNTKLLSRFCNLKRLLEGIKI